MSYVNYNSKSGKISFYYKKMQYRSSRKLIEAEHIFEQIMAENFPNLMKAFIYKSKKLNRHQLR